MGKYIDREKAIDEFTYADADVCQEYADYECEFGFSREAIKDVLEQIPADDVVPVVHGHWIYRGEEKGYQCSVCQSFCLLNYESDWCASECCPHCGSKMDGDSKEVKK